MMDGCHVGVEQKRRDIVRICLTPLSRWQKLIDESYPLYSALPPCYPASSCDWKIKNCAWRWDVQDKLTKQNLFWISKLRDAYTNSWAKSIFLTESFPKSKPPDGLLDPLLSCNRLSVSDCVCVCLGSERWDKVWVIKNRLCRETSSLLVWPEVSVIVCECVYQRNTEINGADTLGYCFYCSTNLCEFSDSPKLSVCVTETDIFIYSVVLWSELLPRPLVASKNMP